MRLPSPSHHPNSPINTPSTLTTPTPTSNNNNYNNNNNNNNNNNALPPPLPPPLSLSSSVMDRVKALKESGLVVSPTLSNISTASSQLNNESQLLDDTIKEWNMSLKKLLLDRDYEKFNRVKNLIDQLYQSRKYDTSITDIIKEGSLLLSKTTAFSSSTLDNHHRSPDHNHHLHQHQQGILSTFSTIASVSGFPFHLAFSSEDVRKKQLQPTSSHLFFDLKACIASICGPGEETELSISIYNRSIGRFISEAYIVKLTYNGMPTDEDRIGRLYTIFTHLSRSDMASDLFLICKIVRCGRMVLPENLPADDKVYTCFRRPFGYAILNLSPIILANDGEKEHLIKIYTCAEQNFSSLFENIIAKNGNYDTSSRAEMICVSINVLHGEIETIIKTNYPRLSIPLTPRYGFPDVILPGDTRNSIYVTLVSGEFAQGRKTSAKNVEIDIEVRLGDGQVLPSPIFMGCGLPLLNSFESTVFYHTNTPRWNETIRCDIPVSNFDRGTHLFCTFRHCSTGDKGDKNDKAFAFAIVPLMKEDETVIEDELHTFQLYKYEKKLVKDAYLCLLDPAVDHSKLTVTKDSFTLRTELCSTKLTQSVSLLQLLRWRKLEATEIKNVLKEFTFIGPVEIIKYLQDIFDALFGMLQSFGNQKSNELSHLVFSALIFVLNIVISDRRFTSFRPILEVYVENHYALSPISHVWIQLVKCMQHLASNPRDPLLAKELRSSLKAWEYLFKFIARSYSMETSSPDSFKDEIRQLFNLTAALFSPDNDSQETLIGAQILVLQNLAAAMTELHHTRLFESLEMLHYVKIFLAPGSKEKRIMAETKCLLATHLITSPIITDLKSRQNISSLLVECVHVYSQEGLLSFVNRLIYEFLIRFGDKLNEEHPEVFSLVPTLLDIFITLDDEQQTVEESLRKAELGVIIIEMLQKVSESDLVEFIRGLPSPQDFFGKILQMSLHLLKTRQTNGLDLFGVFPRSWISILNIVQKVVLKILAVVSDMMQQFSCGTVISMENFQFDLWYMLLSTTVRVMCEVTSLIDEPALNNIENEEIVDIRPRGAQLISLIWFSIRSYHSLFIPKLVGLILELTFCQSSKELQNVALGLLVEMMEIEKKQSKLNLIDICESRGTNPLKIIKRSSGGFMESASKLSSVEIEFIERLDHFIMNSTNKGDPRYHQWLISSLKSRLGSTKESIPFLHALDRFLTLTIFVKTTLQSSAGKDTNISYLIKTSNFDVDDLSLILTHLIQFTSILDRTPIYVKYIHQLADIQLRQENYAEAGWALNLHANLYEWNDNEVPPIELGVSIDSILFLLKSTQKSKHAKSEEYLEGLLYTLKVEKLRSVQSSFTRKETLLLIIVLLFSLAGHFENAICLMETLMIEYSRTLFDFEKVSKAHRVLSSLVTQLANTQRFYPEYYRVAFIGNGWNQESSGMLNVRGKQFIYRAKEWEKLGEFVERMTEKYPGSQLLKSNSWPPESDVSDSDEKWLQICKVDVILNTSKFGYIADGFKKGKVSPHIMGWYEHNDSDSFIFTRPFRKPGSNTGGPADDYLNLWTENYLLKTEHAFPYFLKRSEVIECERTESTPIENAIKNVQMKNRELERLEREFRVYAPSEKTNNKAESKKRSMTMTATSSSISALNANTNADSNKQPHVNCNPLTMSLNGAVDAPVNGGLPMYKKVFLSPSFAQMNPQYVEHVRKLGETIDEQVTIISRCIELHGLIVPPEMRPLHETIVKFFEQNFCTEIERISGPKRTL